MGQWILLGLAVVVVVFAIAVYNRLVTLKNRFKNAFAQIDVQLQRRHDEAQGPESESELGIRETEVGA